MRASSRQVTVEFDVPAEMRDGTVLRADVYRPTGTDSLPTLLARTPYGKHVAAENVWNGIDPVDAARRGFLVVIQDVRGRFASDGVWQPLDFEDVDGHDAVQWAATLPGSNGRVGMFGGSYCGHTQWSAASLRPAALGAIAPSMTWDDPRDGLTARGGAAEFGTDLAWSLLTSIDDSERRGLSERDTFARTTAVVEAFDGLGERGYWELPIPSSGALRGSALGEVRLLSGYAGRRRPSATAEVPSLNTGGWYDLFIQGTLDNYTAMTARGVPARLLVGPWTHTATSDPVGDRVFGLLATRDGAPVHPHGDWRDFQLAWLRDQLVADAGLEFPDTPVRIFVMGVNEWRDEAAWPLARARSERWFLHASGGLSPESPSANASTSLYQYDPANPVPVAGGNTMLWPGFRNGPIDQRGIEARPDVLVFTSEPLEADLEVTGRVRAAVHARSSARSTDWVARLCDMAPDGTSYNLCDGIARVTCTPGEAARHEIDLWSTSNVFLAGHRLRVHVTSGSFPRWDRNLSTGDQQEARLEVAQQAIYHAADRPSYIELPVVP